MMAATRGSRANRRMSASSFTDVATIDVGNSPEAIAYDLTDHEIDVANFGDEFATRERPQCRCHRRPRL